MPTLSKNFLAEISILLVSTLSLSANGLYNADSTTIPTPNSQKLIRPRSCCTDETKPLTVEP